MTITEAKKEAKKEILQDVVDHYNLDNRSVDENEKCVYNGPDGRKCAAARWMDNLELVTEHAGVAENYECLNDTAKLAGIKFMSEIQGLHDNEKYWTNKGLSKAGEIKVLVIKKEYIDEE